MMKKEFTQKMAALSLAGLMIIPTIVFADTTTSTTVPADRPVKERPVNGEIKENLGSRLENGDKPMNNNFGKRGTLDQRGNRDVVNTLELAALYAPELFDSFKTAMNSQESIREAMRALQTEEMDANQAEYQALLASIKSGIESSTLTREAAQAQLEAFRTGQKSTRDTLKTEIEALNATYDFDQDANKTLMTTLKTAIESNDETAIKASLETLLSQLNQRIEYEQAMYNLLSTH